jgi:hypothetical protein
VPGKHITDQQKTKFWFLTRDPKGPRIPVRAAAREIGIHPSTAYRLSQNIPTSSGQRKKARQGDELPAPKRLEELGTDARAALADINLHSEMFFARHPSPWRYEAAMRVGELLSSPDREFIDVNMFPGIGKTTFWTHDLPAWLISGGFFEDPAFGRALRMMFGSRVMKVAQHYVLRLRRALELRRPFYDKDQRKAAEFVLQLEYGRFKPDQSVGEELIWSQDQFLVAQMLDVDIYEKEPTVQAASQESGFLGERVNFAAWDDISVTANSTNPDIASATDGWFEDEAETRVEPGGLLALVGQRLGPLDLHRKRLDARHDDEFGQQVPTYKHMIYPAHHDRLCDGEHRQWDPHTGVGCLTDIKRLSVSDWMKAKGKTNYRTVYQQEDADPAKILVQHAWLTGDVDYAGFQAPGSYDRDRGFWEWPTKVGPLIDYATVDPAAGHFWAMEFWSVSPESRHNWMIAGHRAKLSAGQFLDWDNSRQEFTGLMHEWQVKSYAMGRPIRVWIIEQVSFSKYLTQFEHFARWRNAFPSTFILPHETQRNKVDPELGVEALMPNRYRTGMKHLPKARGIEGLNYLKSKEKELTTYPFSETWDTVMADWFGEFNLDRIISLGRNPLGESPSVSDSPLPGYLKRQQREFQMD